MRIFKTALVLTASALLGANVAAARKMDCAAVEAALSAAEDSAEFALAGDAAALKKGAEGIAASLKAVKPSMGEAAYSAAAAAQGKFDAAAAKAGYREAALAALDIYSAIAAEAGSKLPSGEHVAMLDYAGFRLKAMLKTPQWDAIAGEAAAADGHWQAVKPGMKDTATMDLMDEIHRGMASAAKAQDALWLNNLAGLELAAVDLLERQVKNSSKDACK